MPEVEDVFTVKASLQKVWDFLRDIKNVGTCIPNSEVNIIDPNTSEWKLTTKLGFMPVTVKLIARITEMKPPEYAAWIGEGENVKMAGSLKLRPISNEETEVKFKLNISGSGTMAGIINNVIARKMDEYKNGFISCVKSKLE
jgi:carbon monoxide dehydrogenase subunit G